MKRSEVISKQFCLCFAELLLLPTLSESSRQTVGKPEMQAKPEKPRSANKVRPNNSGNSAPQHQRVPFRCG